MFTAALLSKIIINNLIYLAAVTVALSSRTTGRPNIDTKVLECQLLFLQKRFAFESVIKMQIYNFLREN